MTDDNPADDHRADDNVIDPAPAAPPRSNGAIPPTMPAETVVPPAVIPPAVIPPGDAAVVIATGPTVAHGLQMKRRNPWAVWLGLPLITLGIYHLVWYYKIHHEMGEFDPRRRVPDIGPVLVLIFLSWTIVAPLISYYNCGNRIANAQRAAGLTVTCAPIVGMLLMLVFGFGSFYYQDQLNRVHDAYGRETPKGTDVPLYA